jgi:hypothetical protein
MTPLIEGQKLKFWAEIFIIDARIPYVLVVKISIYFNFLWNLCAISKVALVVCIWLCRRKKLGTNPRYFPLVKWRWKWNFFLKVKFKAFIISTIDVTVRALKVLVISLVKNDWF